MKRLIAASICLSLFTVPAGCSDDCKEPDCRKVVIPAKGDPMATPELLHKLGLDQRLLVKQLSDFQATTFANCYWLAAGGTDYVQNVGWQFSYISAPWSRLNQKDTSALGEFRDQCTDEVYTKQGVEKLIKSKIDDVKTQYVDRIDQLSPEILDAIKKDIEQQVEADLLPKVLEAVKSQVAKQMVTAPAPKTAPKTSKGTASKDH